MDWKDLASRVGQYAPIAGGILGGPAGLAVSAVGSILASVFGTQATPDAVNTALVTDPGMIAKLKQLELDYKSHLADLASAQAVAQIQADAQAAVAVNATMQTEAKADHWPTYSWRPYIAFVFGTNLLLSTLTVCVAFGMQMTGAAGADKAIAALPGVLGALAAINALAAPILGIASWYRGKMQADPNVSSDNRG